MKQSTLPVAIDAARGLSHLALRGAAGVANLAAEVHSVIAQGPWMFDPLLRPDARRAPLPYRIVFHGLRTLADLTTVVPNVADPRSEPRHWLRFCAALNGVMGDRLVAWRSPLATAFGAHAADGTALDLTRLQQASPAGTVLFVHGLCCAELEWQTPAHVRFVAELEANGIGVAWLRYNSGRAIHENGWDLAALLAAHIVSGPDLPPLVLIGHSMGGLVILSACEAASRQEHAWLRQLTHAAYLGSPHHGTPLERAGNRANWLLSVTPYTLPFMRLGNIRSRGIKDLRYGCVTAEDSATLSDRSHVDRRATAVPLLPHIHHLLLAASLDARRGGKWVGDGLVPLRSALGEHRARALRLDAPQVTRVHVTGVNHVAMLGDERVYDALRAWLRPLIPGGD
jgi:hypothetical protein